MLTWRTTAVAALAAVLMAGCSTAAPQAGKNSAAATTAPGPATGAAPKAAHGDEAALESVPWDQVGPGWMLATWTLHPYVPGDPPNTDKTANTTLYLVDPSGDRYPITTFPAPGKTRGPSLVDWSGDGERALFYDQGADKPTPIVVDLHTGTQTAVPVHGTTRFTPSFTLPSGKALLLAKQDDNSNQPPTLERVDLTGKRELLFPTDKLGSPFSGYYLPTPDGTQLILATDAGPMVLMGNDGTVVRTIAMPRGVNRCSPLRWWDGGVGATALAYCGSNLQDQPQLWLMPIAGGAPTALTAPNTQAGDMDAWHVPAATFVSTASQCGELILEKLNADGTTSRVAVPGTDPKRSIKVIGVSDNDLIVRAFPSCAPGEALLDYDPTANTSTVLLGGTVNGGSVTDALMYPGQE